MRELVLCRDCLPERTGEYEVLNNSMCNGGHGVCTFVEGQGWDIPELIAGFYRVIGWFDEVES